MPRTDTTSRYLVFAGAGYLLTDELLTHEGLMCRLLGGEWDDKQGVIWEINPPENGRPGAIEDVTEDFAREVLLEKFEIGWNGIDPLDVSRDLVEWLAAYLGDDVVQAHMQRGAA